MKTRQKWRGKGWRSELWELVRYYRSLRGRAADAWLRELGDSNSLAVAEGDSFAIDPELVQELRLYIEDAAQDRKTALAALREEPTALRYCEEVLGVTVGKTETKSKEHHQSSKAMIAAVSAVAEAACRDLGAGIDPNPQRRAVWCSERGLHVTARNLDGAVPSLSNPRLIWEIKEYWGKTGGGSKMSDAVYECQLVGRELREFEERSGIVVVHAVFLNGKIQWDTRKSDMQRFIDLFHQSLIDYLIIGEQVETEWDGALCKVLANET